jgi:tRNA (adenine22-N1)-methyltransferase
MIKLNKRLTTISAFILKNDKVIDIGCDHNLLAIYMYLEKGIKIVGSDINSEPLNIARNNLLKYDLSNTLELRLGDGISTILGEDTIVISGMGGITITKILDKINDYNIKKLIISPNDKFPLTREFITNKGYKIDSEIMVKDSNKYYLVSVYLKGNEKTDYFFGKLDNKNQDNIDYFNYLIESNNNIINKLSNTYNNKKEELKLENEMIINYLYKE